jgi:superfamily II DNA helicase RecQ
VSSSASALHPAQAQSLAHLSAGESTLTVMATGRGKSLIFTCMQHVRR